MASLPCALGDVGNRREIVVDKVTRSLHQLCILRGVVAKEVHAIVDQADTIRLLADQVVQEISHNHRVIVPIRLRLLLAHLLIRLSFPALCCPTLEKEGQGNYCCSVVVVLLEQLALGAELQGQLVRLVVEQTIEERLARALVLGAAVVASGDAVIGNPSVATGLLDVGLAHVVQPFLLFPTDNPNLTKS